VVKQKVVASTPTPVALRLERMTVSNLGPVKRAQLDLGTDVTFLVGPQSSGKTYLATLAYSLTRHASSFLLTQLVGSVADVFRNQGTFGRISFEAVLNLARDHPKELLAAFARNPASQVVPNLLPNFGFSQVSDLVRYGESKIDVEAEFAIQGQRVLTYQLTIQRTGQATAAVTPNAKAFERVVRATSPQLTVMEGGGWGAQWAGLNFVGSKYIPAERVVFLPVFSPYLGLILRLSQPTGMPPVLGFGTPQFRQTLLDYIVEVSNVFVGSSQQSRAFELLNLGTLDIRGPKITFKDKRRGAIIDIAAAGSGVAQLAGIVIVGESEPAADTLFVEEPELNLHADAQLRVAEYLARLSGRSRIVLTTHSQYIPTMLGIAQAKGELRSLRGYYLNPDNDTAEEVVVDRKTGEVALPQSIERALEQIGEASASLDNSD
jgi:predicted ATPase